MKPLGLYLHIPFCRSKCLYCDFCSVPHAAEETVAQYVEVLCRDMRRQAAQCAPYEVDTVYFGGGTPTILSPEQLERLLGAVFNFYHVAPDAEITSECNPATADRETLNRMRRAGFNRLSIGLQSAQERELRALGRGHSFSDFCRTWEQAEAAGFSNLSADVMFGIPHQTEDSLHRTLEQVCALRPKHVSAYALTVEPDTPFGRRGEAALCLPDEDAVRQMYLNLIADLKGAGIRQYEISNFALPGYESRHNLKYWNAEEYLGFGPAAHSDFGGARFGNACDLARYLTGNLETAERSVPSRNERMNEYVMLRMRLCRGLQTSCLGERFGEEAVRHLSGALERYLSGGFVQRTGEGYAFSPEGMLVSNSILSEILDFHA